MFGMGIGHDPAVSHDRARIVLIPESCLIGV